MISFRSVSFRYGPDFPDAVHDVTFRAEKGEVTALVGKNGSGKSTLLALAAGIIAPRAGKVERSFPSVGGAAFLPQIERVSFSLTALEYVLLGRAPGMFFLSLPGTSDVEAADRALEGAGVAALRDRPVDGLSGGELQLVRIARCMAQEPDVFVFDEPTSMLDPANSVKIAEAITGLRLAGHTVLLSTHDIQFALSCAQSCAVVAGGTVTDSGDTARSLSVESLSRAFGVEFSLEPGFSAFRRGTAAETAAGGK